LIGLAVFVQASHMRDWRQTDRQTDRRTDGHWTSSSLKALFQTDNFRLLLLIKPRPTKCEVGFKRRQITLTRIWTL